MPSYLFRRLDDDDFERAYAIIVEVTDWLLSKGIRQWLQPLPLELYAQRQVLGENYGLYVDDELAAVVSLIDFRPDYWAEYLPKKPFKWLATLASSRKFKGQKLGELIMIEAEQYLAREETPGDLSRLLLRRGHPAAVLHLTGLQADRAQRRDFSARDIRQCSAAQKAEQTLARDDHAASVDSGVASLVGSSVGSTKLSGSRSFAGSHRITRSKSVWKRNS